MQAGAGDQGTSSGGISLRSLDSASSVRLGQKAGRLSPSTRGCEWALPEALSLRRQACLFSAHILWLTQPDWGQREGSCLAPSPGEQRS